VRLYYTRLEREHYLPETPRSDLLKLSIIEWFGCEWLIISAPRCDGHLLRKIATECGLEVVQGALTILGPEGLKQFPINGDNVFSLFNVPDHPVHKSRPEEIKAMMDKETFQVLALRQRWEYRN